MAFDIDQAARGIAETLVAAGRDPIAEARAKVLLADYLRAVARRKETGDQAAEHAVTAALDAIHAEGLVTSGNADDLSPAELRVHARLLVGAALALSREAGRLAESREAS